MDSAPRASRADVDLERAEVGAQCVAHGHCALEVVELRVDQGSGFNEESTRLLPTSRTRSGDGNRRRLPALAVIVEDFDDGSL